MPAAAAAVNVIAFDVVCVLQWLLPPPLESISRTHVTVVVVVTPSVVLEVVEIVVVVQVPAAGLQLVPGGAGATSTRKLAVAIVLSLESSAYAQTRIGSG
jgi:hypothetical protein